MNPPLLRLKKLLLEKSYEKREVVLASGKTSNFYFDGKQTSLHPEGIGLVSAAIFDLIQTHFAGAEAVGGPTLGADPLVTGVSLTSFQKGHPLPAFIIRQEPKKHGTQNWIEGAKNLAAGMQVVILEDVVTTGGSVLKAIEKAEAFGLKVLGVVVIVDREEGGKEILAKKGYPLYSLFCKSELVQ